MTVGCDGIMFENLTLCEYVKGVYISIYVYLLCKGGCLNVYNIYCNHVSEVGFALPLALYESPVQKLVWMNAFSQPRFITFCE